MGRRGNDKLVETTDGNFRDFQCLIFLQSEKLLQRRFIPPLLEVCSIQWSDLAQWVAVKFILLVRLSHIRKLKQINFHPKPGVLLFHFLGGSRKYHFPSLLSNI